MEARLEGAVASTQPANGSSLQPSEARKRSFPRSALFALIVGIHRDESAAAALPRIKPGGIIVVDNANWYLPSDSISLNSLGLCEKPRSAKWAEVVNTVVELRRIWTSIGGSDTAIWFKP